MPIATATFPETPFTLADAKTLGISRKSLDAAVRDGEVIRLLRNVYVRRDIELSVLVRAGAAALVVSPYSVVCDRTAAWLLGVDVRRYRELDVPPPLETCVLRGHDPTDRPEILGMTRDLLPHDITTIGGLRVTTPVRTALDLGAKLPRREALAVMDALMREHKFTVADLRRELPRYFRRRGVIQLRQLVGLVDGRAESRRESWVRLDILDHNLPKPELQWWVYENGVPIYRLDLAYPHARVAVEYDGEDFHSDPDARRRDLERRAWLKSRGWTVIVVTKEDYYAPVPLWIRRLREALRLVP